MKWIKVNEPTEGALIKAIQNNTFFYYVMVFAWVGFMLYGVAYRDMFLILDALTFLVVACTFYNNQKVDKCRLELLRKKC